MKQKISYSSIISGVTIAIFIAFVAIFVLFWVFINKPFDNVFFWILVGLFCLCFIFIFGSIPDSVYADDDYVEERRPFHKKRFNLSDIQSVKVIDSSDVKGGYSFHGKFKNPIVIKFKDGREYIIGSEDSKQLADYINSRLS